MIDSLLSEQVLHRPNTACYVNGDGLSSPPHAQHINTHCINTQYIIVYTHVTVKHTLMHVLLPHTFLLLKVRISKSGSWWS